MNTVNRVKERFASTLAKYADEGAIDYRVVDTLDECFCVGLAHAEESARPSYRYTWEDMAGVAMIGFTAGFGVAIALVYCYHTGLIG